MPSYISSGYSSSPFFPFSFFLPLLLLYLHLFLPLQATSIQTSFEYHRLFRRSLPYRDIGVQETIVASPCQCRMVCSVNPYCTAVTVLELQSNTQVANCTYTDLYYRCQAKEGFRAMLCLETTVDAPEVLLQHHDVAVSFVRVRAQSTDTTSTPSTTSPDTSTYATTSTSTTSAPSTTSTNTSASATTSTSTTSAPSTTSTNTASTASTISTNATSAASTTPRAQLVLTSAETSTRKLSYWNFYTFKSLLYTTKNVLKSTVSPSVTNSSTSTDSTTSTAQGKTQLENSQLSHTFKNSNRKLLSDPSTDTKYITSSTTSSTIRNETGLEPMNTTVASTINITKTQISSEPQTSTALKTETTDSLLKSTLVTIKPDMEISAKEALTTTTTSPVTTSKAKTLPTSTSESKSLEGTETTALPHTERTTPTSSGKDVLAPNNI
ncbi:uncharacterized protein LOC143024738 isoform X1 [Oratosquilla oratoria]|uniref:uncharacterized protein LOC143024738 isoform X1 n=2 Tax=Oratosquilla oratoria TaxID=337810 RepID=UPI003F770A05